MFESQEEVFLDLVLFLTKLYYAERLMGYRVKQF